MSHPKRYDRVGNGGHNATYRARGWRSSAPPTPRAPSPPSGPIVGIIRSDDLEVKQAVSNNAKITGVEDVASYNWLRAAEPTIITPGKPPKWTPTSMPAKLAQDDPKGTYYRDPNAAYFPSYPMEPVIRAIFGAHPDFDGQKIDVFGCGSTLGNLLRFVRNVDADKPFRFLVEAAGETVFLIRQENSPKETIQGIRGYGHTFPEANTTWDPEFASSNTHQRIIRYQLGQLNTMIRFEGDGYLADKISTKETNDTNANREGNEDTLVSALSGNTISAREPTSSDSLNVTRGHGSVPQSAVFDLKTRWIGKKKFDTTTVDEELPRLWIRQISLFILAYHDNGFFRSDEVKVRNMGTEVARWENDNEQAVRKLIGLVEMIADVVKDTPSRKLEVRFQGGLALELREQVEGVNSVLPDDLAGRWANEEGDPAESTVVAPWESSTERATRQEHDSSVKQVVLEEKPIDALKDEDQKDDV